MQDDADSDGGGGAAVCKRTPITRVDAQLSANQQRPRHGAAAAAVLLRLLQCSLQGCGACGSRARRVHEGKQHQRRDNRAAGNMASGRLAFLWLDGRLSKDLSKLLLFHALWDWMQLSVWLVFNTVASLSVRWHTCSPLWTDAECRAWVSDGLVEPMLSFGVPAALVTLCYYLLLVGVRKFDVNLGRNVADEVRGELRTLGYFALFLWLHLYLYLMWLVVIASRYMWWVVPLIFIGSLQDVYALQRVFAIRKLVRHRLRGDDVKLLAALRDLKDNETAVWWPMQLCCSRRSRHA